MGRQEDFERLRDAYATAWDAREAGHPAPEEVLVEELDSMGDSGFSGPGPGRDLMLAVLERGVRPEGLKAELVRAMPGLAWSALTAYGKAAVQVAGYLRPGERPDDAQDPSGGPPAG